LHSAEDGGFNHGAFSGTFHSLDGGQTWTSAQREKSDAIRQIASGGAWRTTLDLVSTDHDPASSSITAFAVGISAPVARNEWYSLDVDGDGFYDNIEDP
jgi:hypothetical protein